jgi:hypothetical protein
MTIPSSNHKLRLGVPDATAILPISPGLLATPIRTAAPSHRSIRRPTSLPVHLRQGSYRLFVSARLSAIDGMWAGGLAGTAAQVRSPMCSKVRPRRIRSCLSWRCSSVAAFRPFSVLAWLGSLDCAIVDDDHKVRIARFTVRVECLIASEPLVCDHHDARLDEATPSSDAR